MNSFSKKDDPSQLLRALNCGYFGSEKKLFLNIWFDLLREVNKEHTSSIAFNQKGETILMKLVEREIP